MTAMLQDIKNMYDRGDTGEYSHVLIMCDTYDYDNYPVYVKHGENPREVAEVKSSQGMSKVDECYSYALGWESQSLERRANHWEVEDDRPA